MPRRPAYSLIVSTLLLISCVHKAPKPAPDSPLSFPFGTYQHAVKVHLTEPVRIMDLKGVVTSQSEMIKMVGITSSGTTIFRVEDNLKTGEVGKEFYLDGLRRNEDKFMFVYALVKETLAAPKGVTHLQRKGARFSFGAPDEQGIPRSVRIEHPQVKVQIEILGYEFF